MTIHLSKGIEVTGRKSSSVSQFLGSDIRALISIHAPILRCAAFSRRRWVPLRAEASHPIPQSVRSPCGGTKIVAASAAHRNPPILVSPDARFASASPSSSLHSGDPRTTQHWSCPGRSLAPRNHPSHWRRRYRIEPGPKAHRYNHKK